MSHNMSHNNPMPDDTTRSVPAAIQPAASQCAWMRNEQAADLKAFVDGELPLVQRVAWGWHLRSCAACRKEIKVMEKMSQELRADDLPQGATPQTAALDSGLRARILERVATTASTSAATPSMKQPASVSLGDAPRNTLFRRSPVLAWGGAAVALLMFVTFTKTFIQGMGGSSEATVFNTANNSLTTSATGENYETDASAPVAAAPPPFVWPSASRESARQEKAASPSVSSSLRPLPQVPSARSGSFQRRTTGNDSLFADGHVRGYRARQETAKLSRSVKRLDDAASSGAVAGAASNAPMGDAAGVPMSQPFGSGMESLDPQRRVHKEAAIAVEVSELEAKSEAVEKMVKSIGGFVASNNLDTGGDGLRRANLLIKIPVARFESVLQSIARLGIVKNKKVSGEDITVQVSDAEQSKTILANQLSQQVERFKRAKLKDKAAERHEARMIQIELAKARARFNLLSKLADLSTLTVQLQEKGKPQPIAQTGFMNELDKTRHAATEAFFSAARVPITLLMWVLAYSPIWLPLLLIYRYASRLGLRRTP